MADDGDDRLHEPDVYQDTSAPVPANDLGFSSPLLKRRNGKLQSCEPCRKAKVSCDHGHPRCGRCTKKGIESDCIYHPAPLTRQGEGPTGVVKRNSASASATSPSVASSVAASGIAASNLLLMLSRQQSTVEPSQSEQTGEYLGPTNYAAIFRETQPQIGAELWRNASKVEEYNGRKHSGPVARAGYNANAVKVGVEALSVFPVEELSDILSRRFFTACDIGVQENSMEYALRQFWVTWGNHMRAKDFRPIAQALLSVPSKSLRAVRTAAEWVESFTGPNLRFEMIGVFFALFGLAAMSKPAWDPLFDVQKHGRAAKKIFVEVYGEAADACLDLCAGESTATEPLIWMMHFIQICQSQYRGDDDAFLWQKSGLIATAVTSFGLHREGSMTNVPFMVAESRRRTFASVYVSDKQLATFTGRPPRLSKRYCVCKLPLELSDVETMAEGDELKQILDRLDKDGWATDGKFRSIGILRLFMVMARIRDEVLELCLGPSTEVSESRKQELKQKADEAYYGVPSRFILENDDAKLITMDRDQLCTQIMFRMEYLFNLFLVDRMSSSEGDESSQANLIKTALSMLTCLSWLQKYRDKLADFMTGMAWWTVYYAIPCASILGLELMKQHQYPRRYKQNLPRSEVIQLLSIYILCLSSVGPEEGNYQICQRMHKVVKKILDEVLDPQPEPDHTTPSSTSQMIPDVDISAMMAPNDDPDFMDWLQSVDWTKAPWMDPLGGF